jgi:hypothetical protein
MVESDTLLRPWRLLGMLRCSLWPLVEARRRVAIVDGAFPTQFLVGTAAALVAKAAFKHGCCSGDSGVAEHSEDDMLVEGNVCADEFIARQRGLHKWENKEESTINNRNWASGWTGEMLG